MPPAGAPGARQASSFPLLTSHVERGVHASHHIQRGVLASCWVEGLIGHDEEEGSQSIVWAHYCYELSLLPQQPSKTKQLWWLHVFDQRLISPRLSVLPNFFEFRNASTNSTSLRQVTFFFRFFRTFIDQLNYPFSTAVPFWRQTTKKNGPHA